MKRDESPKLMLKTQYHKQGALRGAVNEVIENTVFPATAEKYRGGGGRLNDELVEMIFFICPF